MDYSAAAGSKDQTILPVAYVTENTPPRMVRVIAPTQLPPGYQLQVQCKDSSKSFTVTVPRPERGSCIQEGEIFLAPIPPGYKIEEELIDVPTGRWKDGLFDFCSYGCLHPHLWCAICCKEVALGQVMQRMRLSWLGQPMEGDRALSTFRTVVTVVVCYILFDMSMDMLMGSNDVLNGGGGGGYYYAANVHPFFPIAKNIVAILFSLWSTYALYKTRRQVRSEFSIPEQNCIGCEDCMCAVFCGCCSVAQMARHTGDYDKNPALLCSETGLPGHVPFAAPMAV